ncbi:zinc ribbon domain-containing protein [Archangium lipolyticum]|uniref:zinc ribbon domain-containing protein n=1 Tax=Archangium lipolyticum TaxID=2970465 RepID=UPI00214A5F31|nr:zinc ribbon domain-containing protein [Archangium lipolyticum]
MRCKECGERAQDPTLRYCENCGAKMPTPPPGSIRRTSTGTTAVQTTGRSRSTSTARAVQARDEAEDTNPGPRRVRVDDADEHTDPGRPAAPPYDGPLWLAHVPGHSPSVLGVGLLGIALVLGILPFFASVGALSALAVVAGGWLVTAREMRAAGARHGLVDWVPDSLLHPAVPAVYTVLTVGLAIRMLGIGLTPLLWLGGAGLIGYDQYRKVYAGESGWSRLFEPRQLVRGTSGLALGGVVLCLVSLFLTWTPGRSYSGPVPTPQGPPGLQVVDAPRPSDDVVYSLLAEAYDKGWDKPLAEMVELLLLAVLALLALRPEVARPGWLRFAPLAVVVIGLVWTLACGALLAGPLLFIGGLAAVGFAGVYQAFTREA